MSRHSLQKAWMAGSIPQINQSCKFTAKRKYAEVVQDYSQTTRGRLMKVVSPDRILKHHNDDKKRKSSQKNMKVADDLFTRSHFRTRQSSVQSNKNNKLFNKSFTYFNYNTNLIPDESDSSEGENSVVFNRKKISFDANDYGPVVKKRKFIMPVTE